jgi:hypothetical protein
LRRSTLFARSQSAVTADATGCIIDFDLAAGKASSEPTQFSPNPTSRSFTADEDICGRVAPSGGFLKTVSLEEKADSLGELRQGAVPEVAASRLN